MLVTEDGMVTLYDTDVLSGKAVAKKFGKSHLEATVAGIETAVSFVSRKAKSPMLVTEAGMTTEARSVSTKAKSPMLVTEDGIITSVSGTS